ncbi:MAG TPA: peptidase [Allosphingosinicella sp.]|nr:peptidase [Allosphingosinicella sp.]
MTYCVGLLLDDGLVMIADTRTNAGVDNFSCYRKLHPIAAGPDRKIYLCTSGSLSMTQSVVGMLTEPTDEEGEDPAARVTTAPSMFRVAQIVGEAVKTVNRTVGAALAEANISSSVSLLLGGRVGSEPPALYLVYSAGNFIECSTESPFLQVGETKYGKPILDRGIRHDTPLPEGMKVALLSFDSAMRSNLGVARPLDLVVMPSNPNGPLLERRIEADDAYFNDLSLRWAALLHEATRAIPAPPFMAPFAPDQSLSRAAE